MFVFSCLVYIGMHPKLSLSLNLWSVNVCFSSQVILTCLSAAHVWCCSPNTCSNLLHSQKEMLAQQQFFIADGQLTLLGGKHGKYASSGFQLKWSLIPVALMKKNFVCKCRGSSIDCFCKAFGNSESSLPWWSLALGRLFARLWAHPSLCHLSAVPEGRKHYHKGWNLLLERIGSPPGGEQSLAQQSSVGAGWGWSRFVDFL